MGNQGSTAATALARNIESSRRSAGHTQRQLSERSGIPYSTLRRKIDIAPELFTVREVCAIAVVLNTSLETLFADAA